jgi:hypothetical protein
MHILVAMVLLLAPPAIAPGFSFYFDVVPKTVILLGGAALLLLVTALKPAALIEFSSSRFGRLLCLGSIGSIAVVLAATVLCYEPLAAWNGSNWRQFGRLEQIALIVGATLLSALCSQSESLRSKVLKAICVAGGVNQVNAVVPAGVSGPAMPLQFAIRGITTSNQVTSRSNS